MKLLVRSVSLAEVRNLGCIAETWVTMKAHEEGWSRA